MGVWRRIKRDMIVAMASLQETALAIAERVNDRVEEVKRSIAANDLEREIQTDLAILGEKVFRKSDLTLSQVTKEADLLALLAQIDTRQKELAALESSLKEAPFDYLEQTLSHAHLMIQNVIITAEFPGAGKQIRSLALPPQLKILLVRKKGRIHLAQGQTVIDLQDEVIFIGEKANLNSYKTFWHYS